MMSAASLVGFGLAFFLTSWLLSALIGGAILAASGAARRRGPALERAAAAAGLVTPPLVAFGLTTALIVHSVAAFALGGDHCPAHVHHLHLCVVHGGAWGQEPWAVVALAVLGTALVAAMGRMAAAHLLARGALRRLERSAETIGDVYRVPSQRRFCFVAGLRRARIYISTAAWDALGREGRQAALAHERRHAARGDVARRMGLGVAALFGAPWVARRLLARWSSATERVCDREAAEALGDATALVDALMVLARSALPPPAGAAGFPAPADELAMRIEALFAPRHADGVVAARLWRGALVAAAAATSVAVVHADPVHHVLESLLGVL